MNIFLARTLVVLSYCLNVVVIFFLVLIAATSNGEQGSQGWHNITLVALAASVVYFVLSMRKMLKQPDGMALWKQTTKQWWVCFGLACLVAALVATFGPEV